MKSIAISTSTSLQLLFPLVLLSMVSYNWSKCHVNGLATERRPWNAFRFIQQSSKFVNLPFAGTSTKTRSTKMPGDILWSAESPQSQQEFTMAPLDDVVMGGASSSTFDKSTGIWSGSVTDANNGGFIGIRSTVQPGFQWDMSKCRGLEWKVKLLPDGNNNNNTVKRFKFVLRDSTEFNGITWTTSVDLKPGKVTTVKIPFNKQIPALFARKVPNQTFRNDNVVAVQIAYSKFEYDGDLNPHFQLGDIKLQLIELRAY